MNEEKVTVAGCSTGSKEFLRRKVDKNVANKKHRNTPRINNNRLIFCPGIRGFIRSKVDQEILLLSSTNTLSFVIKSK